MTDNFEPVAGSDDNSADTPAGGVPAVDTRAVDSPAIDSPAPRKRARRATKATAAPVITPDEVVAGAAEAAGDRSPAEVAFDEPAPTKAKRAAKAAPRKKSAAKAAKKQAAAPDSGLFDLLQVPEVTAEEQSDAHQELVVSDAPTESGTPTESGPTAESHAPIESEEATEAGDEVADADDTDADDTDEGDTEDTTVGAAPLAPAFGLLFQAPQAAAPRRASRPAGSAATRPVPAPEPVEPAQEPADAEDAQPAESDDVSSDGGAPNRSRRRRGGRGRRARTGDDASAGEASGDDAAEPEAGDEESEVEQGGDDSSTARRRRRRRRGAGAGESDDPPGTVTRVREARRDEPQAVKGSTRLEAKRMRRREGREAGRRRTIITEKEFLARRESVERVMVVRRLDGRTQIGVLEDGILVEHYVSRTTNVSLAGNVYLGRVQNVLPSMEAAFVDIGRGRNAVLYAGEVNWDVAGLVSGEPKRIENVLSSGESVLVQVTKDPIGHKGARLTSQISLPGRYLVYVPQGSMTGISRKLPDTERNRLKSILKEIVPADAGVIVRTAAEGASEEEMRRDVERLAKKWERINTASAGKTGRKGSNAPTLLYAEPDLTVRVIRDVFNEDFTSLVVSGDDVWTEISDYVEDVAPDLAARMTKWTGEQDIFTAHRIDEQLAKALDRKVFLPSGGSLVIDRTEAMTVVDVNTGKFVGSGGNLEETVTKNNLEAAEEIVRQLRLRDIGGIIVIDFIDMVLESNRDLVVRRLLECLGRDRTKHQVAEVTSLGLVQMTRKRVASGLLEVFSEICDHCDGRGVLVRSHPVDKGVDGGSGAFDTGNHGSGTHGSGSHGSGSHGSGNHSSGANSGQGGSGSTGRSSGSRSRRGRQPDEDRNADRNTDRVATEEAPVPARGGPTAAQIAAAAHAAAVKSQNRQELPVPEDETSSAPAVEAKAVTEPIVAGVGIAETEGSPVAGAAEALSSETEAADTEGSETKTNESSGSGFAGSETAGSETEETAAVTAELEPGGEDSEVSAPEADDDGSEPESAEGEAAAYGQSMSQPRSGGRPRRRRGRATSPAGPPRAGGGDNA
ncbi:MAG: Rne/Rng family ribonuclease [Tetrasphaera jenkinsii]|jgi:ribonuclease E|nr:Rne/Rng family ribonuclease [Tetrasphaera jenkinsii]